MKTLVLSASGDPLFVRDDDGHDFEVEVTWATDARHQSWGDERDARWDALWNQVYNDHPPPGARRLPLRQVDLADEPMIMKPALRVLTTHRLPPLEERDEHARRARALGRLGGSVPANEIVARRAEAARREELPANAIALPSWAERIFPGIRQYVSDQAVFAAPGSWRPPPDLLTGKMSSFSNIHAALQKPIPLQKIVSYAETSTVTTPADAAQTRREEAIRRLQDPVDPDFDPSVQADIRNMLDGLRRRPVL